MLDHRWLAPPSGSRRDEVIVVTFAHRPASPVRMTVISKGHVGRVIRGDVGTELICSPHQRKRGVPIDVDRIEVANRSLGDLGNEGAPDSWGVALPLRLATPAQVALRTGVFPAGKA